MTDILANYIRLPENLTELVLHPFEGMFSYNMARKIMWFFQISLCLKLSRLQEKNVTVFIDMHPRKHNVF